MSEELKIHPAGIDDEMEPLVPPVEVITCGRCKREKVEGKCPACGRPPEYTTDEEMIAKVDEYLLEAQDEEIERVKQRNEEKGYEMLETKISVKLPTLDGFSLMLGINDDTLVEWRKQHKEFSAAVERISQFQKERLINKGLSGDYNPSIAKLILSANHGMAEKTQQDITTGGKELPAGIIINTAAQTLTNKYEEELKGTL